MRYFLTQGQLDAPADAGAVDLLSEALGVMLPKNYTAFLKLHNGGEGFIGDSYIILWKAEELADFNRQYEVEKYAPGVLIFASSGGGEAYGFDIQSPSMPIIRVPFVGMAREYAEPVGIDLPDLFPIGESAMHGFLVERPRGMELVDIKPAIVGGDPCDPENKTLVTRQQHFELVRFWNRVISDLRNGSTIEGGIE